MQRTAYKSLKVLGMSMAVCVPLAFQPASAAGWGNGYGVAPQSGAKSKMKTNDPGYGGGSSNGRSKWSGGSQNSGSKWGNSGNGSSSSWSGRAEKRGSSSAGGGKTRESGQGGGKWSAGIYIPEGGRGTSKKSDQQWGGYGPGTGSNANKDKGKDKWSNSDGPKRGATWNSGSNNGKWGGYGGAETGSGASGGGGKPGTGGTSGKTRFEQGGRKLGDLGFDASKFHNSGKIPGATSASRGKCKIACDVFEAKPDKLRQCIAKC